MICRAVDSFEYIFPEYLAICFRKLNDDDISITQSVRLVASHNDISGAIKSHRRCLISGCSHSRVGL